MRDPPAALPAAMRASGEPHREGDMAGASPAGDAALRSRDAAEREAAVLAFEGDLAALAELATEDPSPDVRRAAVQRLAEGETPLARAALRNALDDPDASVLAEAILALAALGEPTARPGLERLRAHPDAEVRALAEDALAALER